MGRNERWANRYNPNFRFIPITGFNQYSGRSIWIKSPEEIERIQKAVTLSRKLPGHESLLLIQPGIYEYEIAGHDYLWIWEGKAIHAFEPIVAFRALIPVSCIIRPIPIDVRKDILLIDFGAEVDGYAADMTRCLAVDGTMTKRQFACIWPGDEPVWYSQFPDEAGYYDRWNQPTACTWGHWSLLQLVWSPKMKPQMIKLL